MVTGIIYYI